MELIIACKDYYRKDINNVRRKNVVFFNIINKCNELKK